MLTARLVVLIATVALAGAATTLPAAGADAPATTAKKKKCAKKGKGGKGKKSTALAAKKKKCGKKKKKGKGKGVPFVSTYKGKSSQGRDAEVFVYEGKRVRFATAIDFQCGANRPTSAVQITDMPLNGNSFSGTQQVSNASYGTVTVTVSGSVSSGSASGSVTAPAYGTGENACQALQAGFTLPKTQDYYQPGTGK